MALGFLQPSTEDKPMEDIGYDYVKYLLWNSFFQDVEKDDVRGIRAVKMHDLVVDLACSLSRFDSVTVGAKELKNKYDVLHLRLRMKGDVNLNLIQEGLCNMRKLRLLHLDCTKARTPICSNVLDILFKKLKHLRVLDLNGCMIQKLPSSIKKLKYLRHLNLDGNPIEVLPASITVLYHLQSLDLNDCPLRELPQDMRNLINLRQLLIYQKDGCLSQMPINMGRLIFLNYLRSFVVGHKKEQSIKELQHLDLRYRLRLLNLENVKSRGEAEEANLMGKKNLNWLGLIWRSHTSSGYMSENDKKKTLVAEEDVLEGLRPHPNLKRLNIHNYGGVNFPGWMMSGCELFLPNLVKLFLKNCERLERVPPLGQLPSLKVLHLKGVKRMKRLGIEFYHDEGSNYNPQAVAAINTTTTALFPSLKELYLLEMLNLEEWVEPPQQRQGGFVIPFLPRLEKLSVEDCPKLMIMPTQFPSLKLLQIIKSNGIMLSSVTKVPSLTTLEIVEVPNLKFLPKGLLHCTITILDIEKCLDLEAIIMPSEEEEEGVEVQALPSTLEILQICHCPLLTSLPNLHGLQSIRRLFFFGNEKISRLPELHTLRTLEVLNIGGFSSELESFPDLEPLQHLPSLRSLFIRGWSKLTSLPEQLQFFTRLDNFGIHTFNSVAALPEWLGNLSSLRWLRLEKCNNLMNLPKEEGLRCFTALNGLMIDSCPLLKERCSRERGEEWPKIKHIQKIKIDGRYV